MVKKMKILLLSDVPDKGLWDYYEDGKLSEYDLILSAGDLPAAYLCFLVTLARCPLVYVHGNHDTHYDIKPPEGCICADDRVIEVNGLRILGLGGSMCYRPGSCQYTEKEMQRRILKRTPGLLLKSGFDILLTHAPVKGINDMEDPCHQGFECFRTLLDRYKPSYMVHGHVHMNYGHQVPRLTTYNQTTIINAYTKYMLEIDR